MSQLGTVYATKRRRRNGKSLKPPPKDGVTKSNPSKRHRERLNAELDTLASLLPFEQNILSKLDRLSILRLSVSYLRTKSYFQVVMHKDKEDQHGGMLSHCHNLQEPSFRNRDLTTYEHAPLDGDTFLQALNGFLMILTCEGEVFFATHSIESYLGFHQSDIVHQSVYELVHSEDREELQRQLLWNSFIGSSNNNQHQPSPGGNGQQQQHQTSDQQQMSLQEVLMPHNSHLLERSFTVRFRCLLDNTSGFLRLDIRGRVKVLHGQNRKTEEPPLALFAICTPFGPPSLLEIPQKEVMFKSKHKLDLGLVSMDQRGKMLLGYSDGELANMGGYDLVHFDDLAYVASAHQELLKTGASGMIAYRFQTKEGQWQWLQTSSRLVYKNSKPDFVISTHRPLMEEEGRDLLGKRTMDFKVSYLDAGLTNSYFTDSDNIMTSVLPTATSPTIPLTPTNQRVNRRYKTQLRDFLSTCRTKRKLSAQQSPHPSPLQTVPTVPSLNSPIVNTNNINNNNINLNINNNNNNSSPHLSTVMMDYLPTENHLMTPIAAYHHHPNIYSQATYGQTDNALYMGHQTFQTMYPDNIFHQYQRHHLTGYYATADYQTTGGYVTAGANGFLEVSPRASYDGSGVAYHQLGTGKEDKLYACAQVLESPKYAYATAADPAIRAYTTYPVSSPLITTTPLSDSKVTPPPTQNSPGTDPSPKAVEDPSASIKSEISLASGAEVYPHHRYSADKNEATSYEHQSDASYTPTGRQSVSDGYTSDRVRHGEAGTYQATSGDHRTVADAYTSDQQRQTVLMWGSAMITDRERENSPTNSNSSTPSMNGYDGKLIKHDTGNGLALHHSHQPQNHHGLHQSHLHAQLHHQTQHNNLSPHDEQELSSKHRVHGRHSIEDQQQHQQHQACKWSNGLQQQVANFANHQHQEGDNGVTMAEVWQPYQPHENETIDRDSYLHHRYHNSTNHHHHRHNNHQFLHQHFNEHYRAPQRHDEQNHHQVTPTTNNAALYNAQSSSEATRCRSPPAALSANNNNSAQSYHRSQQHQHISNNNSSQHDQPHQQREQRISKTPGVLCSASRR